MNVLLWYIFILILVSSLFFLLLQNFRVYILVCYIHVNSRQYGFSEANFSNVIRL